MGVLGFGDICSFGIRKKCGVPFTKTHHRVGFLGTLKDVRHVKRTTRLKKEYLSLEKELADPDTTYTRRVVIESKLKKLTKELKDPANLPQVVGNKLYSPEDVENFEC